MANTPQQNWNKRFSGPEYHFGKEPNAFLESQSHRLEAGQKVLSIADGEGRNGVYMAGLGCDVLAVDFSPAALQKSHALASERGVSISTLEVDHTHWSPEPETYDVVAAIFIQFAGPDLRPKLFADIKSALKPGGLLLMQGYRPEQIENGTGGPPFVENMYTEDLLRDAFAGYEFIDLNSHDKIVEEGPGHSGISALIDMVARKPV